MLQHEIALTVVLVNSNLDNLGENKEVLLAVIAW